MGDGSAWYRFAAPEPISLFWGEKLQDAFPVKPPAVQLKLRLGDAKIVFHSDHVLKPAATKAMNPESLFDELIPELKGAQLDFNKEVLRFHVGGHTVIKIFQSIKGR